MRIDRRGRLVDFFLSGESMLFLIESAMTALRGDDSGEMNGPGSMIDLEWRAAGVTGRRVSACEGPFEFWLYLCVCRSSCIEARGVVGWGGLVDDVEARASGRTMGEGDKGDNPGCA